MGGSFCACSGVPLALPSLAVRKITRDRRSLFLHGNIKFVAYVVSAFAVQNLLGDKLEEMLPGNFRDFFSFQW